MANIYQTYNYIFTELGDQRVQEWPMMGGPIPVFFLLTFYLYMIKIKLPDYMRDKPAYSLKTIIKCYNIFQVIANSLVFTGLLTSGWLTTLHFGCVMPDYSTEPEAMNMARWMWWCLMLKMIELIETAFFVLRKKDNQASFLHVYHHVITLLITWVAVKFVPGGMASLTPLINTGVHVIMYSYYWLSSVAGPGLRKKLNKWKMWLTIIQMAQFTVLLFHSLQALHPSCPAPRFIVWIYIPNLILVYYLFWDFFKNTYKKPPQKTA